ncbi:MAG TPA: hypothetical protein EYQ74_02705 [Planctomycetes bacterium]|nr:hypothetical protein [Planctomycetota bacterium]HIK60926.1 hypothetical protein [Planctomycetota bacterium]
MAVKPSGLDDGAMVLLSTMMPPLDPDWRGLCIWAVPAFLLVPLWVGSPRGERTTWTVAALLLGLIWLDKILDLQSMVHHAGQELIGALDSQWRMRGPHLWMRWVLLGSTFLAAVAGITVLVRCEQHVSPAKILTLTGFLGIAGFVTMRHLPAIHTALASGLDRWLEWGCLGLVLSGLTWGLVGIRGHTRAGPT